jgi:hypothetical protein
MEAIRGMEASRQDLPERGPNAHLTQSPENAMTPGGHQKIASEQPTVA